TAVGRGAGVSVAMAAELESRTVPRREPTLALLGAVACALCLVATGLIALLAPVAQAHDAQALAGITRLDRGGLSTLTEGIVHLADPTPYAIFGLGLIAVALVRRRPRLAVAVPVVLVGAAATSELLKPLLATPPGPGGLDP